MEIEEGPERSAEDANQQQFPVDGDEKTEEAGLLGTTKDLFGEVEISFDGGGKGGGKTLRGYGDGLHFGVQTETVRSESYTFH